MTATTEVTIKNNTSNKYFLFRCVTPFNSRKSQPSIDIPLINSTAGNNVIFRFTGQKEEVSFSFAIFNDGVDVANGSHTSTVTTIAEQIAYLKDVIYTESYSTSWTLYDAFDLIYPSASAVTFTIEEIDFNIEQGRRQTIVVGSIRLKRGRIGATA